MKTKVNILIEKVNENAKQLFSLFSDYVTNKKEKHVYMLILPIMNLFITPTFCLNFILLLCFNQKAILIGSIMQWFYWKRMQMYYPIKILDTIFLTHLHTNGPVINSPFTIFVVEKNTFKLC
jgi:type III secretory pathway component EscU